MIHKYSQHGLYIVLDVGSGGVHVVDRLTYDLLDYAAPPFKETCPPEILACLPDYDPEDVREGYRELAALCEEKILFAPDNYEPYAGAGDVAPIKAMCLHIAHDCNLRCRYCFASTGDFGTGRKLMSADTGKKAIDFLLAHSGARRNLEVDFFGGEPLMNFEAVREVVRYAREKEPENGKCFRFTLTTNGIGLDDESIDFINREMVNVVLSIDGRQEVHDRMRPSPSGKGSYDIVLPKFQTLVARRSQDKDYYVRGTFTKYNLDFTKDVLSLYDAGFDQISVEPVVADPALDYALTEEDLPAIFAEYERLTDTMLDYEAKGKRFNFFHFMIDLSQGPCVIKRLRGCGCGNEYVAITPDGDIYPCHQFVGIESFRMGNLEEETFDREAQKVFARANIYNKENCRECWAKYYCSGGCNANNFQYQGDILRSHPLSCAMEKKRVECAVTLQAVRMLRESGEGEDFFEKNA